MLWEPMYAVDTTASTFANDGKLHHHRRESHGRNQKTRNIAVVGGVAHAVIVKTAVQTFPGTDRCTHCSAGLRGRAFLRQTQRNPANRARDDQPKTHHPGRHPTSCAAGRGVCTRTVNVTTGNGEARPGRATQPCAPHRRPTHLTGTEPLNRCGHEAPRRQKPCLGPWQRRRDAGCSK